MNDIIIIGAGMAGLYTAYKTIQNYPNLKITILEKNSRIGGRVYTYNDSKFNNIEAGAGRFSKKHKLLLKLIHELKLSHKIIPISNNNHIVNINEPCNLQKSNTDKYLNKILSNITESDNYLKNITFKTYAKEKLDKEEFQYLLEFFPYSSKLNHSNAYDAIYTIKNSFLNKINYFILKGGLSQLTSKLYDILIKKGVTILNNKQVDNIQYDQDVFHIKCNNIKQIYKSNICICATTKDFIESQNIFKSIKKYLNYIKLIPLCRIYSKYNDNWFSEYPKIVFNDKLNRIIPIDQKNNVIMISYTDAEKATFWNQNYKKSIYNVNKKLKEYIDKSLCIELPNPNSTKVFFWNIGVAVFKPGFNSENMLPKIIHPDNSLPLFVCGENFSHNISWIEGALDTSEIVLQKLSKFI
jgi:hypothetical protein